MSAVKVLRTNWIIDQIREGKSDARIVLECMKAFPGTSEACARRELRAVIQRFTELNEENLPEAKTRFLEMGFDLLKEAKELGQLSAAVNQFKNLAILQGLYNEKDQSAQQNTGTPESSLVRQRMQQLMKSKAVQDAAKDVGIDMAELKAEPDE